MQSAPPASSVPPPALPSQTKPQYLRIDHPLDRDDFPFSLNDENDGDGDENGEVVVLGAGGIRAGGDGGNGRGNANAIMAALDDIDAAYLPPVDAPIRSLQPPPMRTTAALREAFAAQHAVSVRIANREVSISQLADVRKKHGLRVSSSKADATLPGSASQLRALSEEELELMSPPLLSLPSVRTTECLVDWVSIDRLHQANLGVDLDTLRLLLANAFENAGAEALRCVNRRAQLLHTAWRTPRRVAQQEVAKLAGARSDSVADGWVLAAKRAGEVDLLLQVAPALMQGLLSHTHWCLLEARLRARRWQYRRHHDCVTRARWLTDGEVFVEILHRVRGKCTMKMEAERYLPAMQANFGHPALYDTERFEYSHKLSRIVARSTNAQKFVERGMQKIVLRNDASFGAAPANSNNDNGKVCTCIGGDRNGVDPLRCDGECERIRKFRFIHAKSTSLMGSEIADFVERMERDGHIDRGTAMEMMQESVPRAQYSVHRARSIVLFGRRVQFRDARDDAGAMEPLPAFVESRKLYVVSKVLGAYQFAVDDNITNYLLLSPATKINQRVYTVAPNGDKKIHNIEADEHLRRVYMARRESVPDENSFVRTDLRSYRHEDFDN